MAGRTARGDARLYQFAPPAKKRPVVVLTRDSAISHLSTVPVAPITSAIRGVPSAEVRVFFRAIVSASRFPHLHYGLQIIPPCSQQRA